MKTRAYAPIACGVLHREGPQVMRKGFVEHIELVLTSMGVCLTILIVILFAAQPTMRWQAATVAGLSISSGHGIIFWVIRQRRMQLVRDINHRQAIRDTLLLTTQRLCTTDPPHDILFSQLATLAVTDFADWCSIVEATPGKPLRRAALACANPAHEPLRRQLLDHLMPEHATVSYRSVLQSGETRFVAAMPADALNDLLPDRAYQQLIIAMRIESIITVPLIVANAIVGAAAFIRRTGSSRYTHADQRVAEDWARQVTRTLDHAVLVRRAQRQIEEIDAVRQLARMMVQQADLLTLLTCVVEQVATKFGYQLVSAYSIEADQLVLRAHVGQHEALATLPLIGSASGRAIQNGRAELITDVDADPDFCADHPGITQAIIVPLRQRNGDQLGVLVVESNGSPALTTDDLALLNLLADHVSIVADFALMAGRLERSERTLRAERSLFVHGPVVVFRWGCRPDWPIEYVSANVDQFGYDAEVLIAAGQPFNELIVAEDTLRVSTESQDYLRNQRGSFDKLYRMRTMHAEPRWVRDVTVVRRNATGTTTYYDGYLIDITDQVAAAAVHADLERQLAAAHKLESLGMLAAGVAHDFNNFRTFALTTYKHLWWSHGA